MSNLKTLRARKDVRLSGAGNPTVATVASVGDTYQNETTGELFTCTESVDYGWGFVQDWAGSQGTLIDADILNPANANLIAGYTMDDISGSTLNDMSSNNNDGTINGAIQVAGQIGNALECDAVDDNVVLFHATGTSGAVSVWVRPDDTLNGPTIGMSDPASDNALLVGYNSGINGYLIIHNDTDVAVNRVNSTADRSGDDGQWHHLVFQTDGSTWEIYRDGVLEAITASLGTNVGDWWDDVAATQEVYIGGNFDQSPTYHGGAIDHLRFFDRDLTQAEITTLFNEGSV